MNQFMKWFINSARYLFAEFFVQILAFVIFCIAGVVWVYFSTIYAVIPVVVVGIALGTYIYGLIEGEKSEKEKKNKK